MPANAVPRRELVTGLTGTAGCRLVMVGAPAGYGKSQVCAQWSRTDGRAAAWINVEARQRDANVLVRALDREPARRAVPRERQPRSVRVATAWLDPGAQPVTIRSRSAQAGDPASVYAAHLDPGSIRRASFVTWPKDPGAGAVRDPGHRASSRSTAAAARTLAIGVTEGTLR